MKRLVGIIASTATSSSLYPKNRMVTAGSKRFSVKYNEVDASSNADSMKAWQQFHAQVTEVHPYDEAEYAWARIGHRCGVIDYIKNGKIIDTSYYSDAEDANMSITEWYDSVIDMAIENLLDINKDVKSKMRHN